MIERPKKPAGQYVVRVYNPAIGRKKYVGTYQTLKEAKAGEREAAASKRPDRELAVAEYAAEWLRVRHGPSTRRPAERTQAHNEGMLRPFLADFGTRRLDSISRRDALAWARDHPGNAKAVSALYNDAIDDEVCSSNPFANRRQPQSRERKDIAPLTEDEVGRLADIALEHWGPQTYGLVARAWVLFGAWVGCRPGETFGVRAADLNLDAGEVTIRRVKRRGSDYPTDVVVLPQAAADAIQQMPILQYRGPIFRTITGALMAKGALRYHWDPIRCAFRQTISSERCEALLGGQENLDFYVLRHFVASIIVARGGNEFDVAAQLGDSPEVARRTYIHSYRISATIATADSWMAHRRRSSRFARPELGSEMKPEARSYGRFLCRGRIKIPVHWAARVGKSS